MFTSSAVRTKNLEGFQPGKSVLSVCKAQFLIALVLACHEENEGNNRGFQETSKCVSAAQKLVLKSGEPCRL